MSLFGSILTALSPNRLTKTDQRPLVCVNEISCLLACSLVLTVHLSDHAPPSEEYNRLIFTWSVLIIIPIKILTVHRWPLVLALPLLYRDGSQAWGDKTSGGR